MYTLHFSFDQKGVEPQTIQSSGGGDSILEIALDNGIELHHNCGMVCACSTCHIYLESGEDLVPELTDREEDFIDRARNPRINSRLGCQCILQAGGAGEVHVRIPDQKLIHGE